MITYSAKEIEKMKKLINPNSDKYSDILVQMYEQTKNKYEFAFANLPNYMDEDDRIKLLKWYKCFGDKGYEYSLSEHSIIGKIIK